MLVEVNDEFVSRLPAKKGELLGGGVKDSILDLVLCSVYDFYES